MADIMNSVLGLPQECKDFADKKTRTAYPVSMKKFPAFVQSLSVVNVKKLWTNMLFDEGAEALKTIMEISFKDNDVDDVLENINAGNYIEIIETILSINGIEFQKEDESDPNVARV